MTTHAQTAFATVQAIIIHGIVCTVRVIPNIYIALYESIFLSNLCSRQSMQ
jgi:hypothetical protein